MAMKITHPLEAKVDQIIKKRFQHSLQKRC